MKILAFLTLVIVLESGPMAGAQNLTPAAPTVAASTTASGATSGALSNSSPGALTMDQYLDQVRGDNNTYKGSVQFRNGAKGRESEADLVTAYTLTGELKYVRDKKIPDNPIISYDSIDTGTYTLGVEKVTTFGLDAKLSYDVDTVEYVNSNIGQYGGASKIINAAPTLTLTQSLWQNAFGSLTQATVESKDAQAKSDLYNNQYSVDTTMQNAISAYWTLVLQREVVQIRQLAVQQAQSVFDYNTRRARMNLGEQSDVLTAKASLESRKLDLQSAIDDEETQRRLFNQYRNRPPMEDPGPLAVVDWNFLASFKMPERHGDRSDVKYAKFQAVANSANSRIQAENDRPVFNAYGSYARNGRDSDVPDTLISSYRTNRPTTTVGVKLSMPLDFDALNKAEQGARAQAKASQVLYDQKARDQEADWADLQAKMIATQRRIVLAGTIEEAQKSKLDFERLRLRQGRTSTYQVLLFEQDYTSARLARIQTASDMIALFSRARLYTAAEEGSIR